MTSMNDSKREVMRVLVNPLSAAAFAAAVAAVLLTGGPLGLWFVLFVAFMNLRSIARDVAVMRERSEETRPTTVGR